jgi:DNA polymerase III subunit epsilon
VEGSIRREPPHINPGSLDGATYTPTTDAPETWDAETAAMMARALSRTGQYRVVERLGHRSRYHPGACDTPRTGLFVDVETTGLDPDADKIIQLALVAFTFDSDGRIYDVEPCVSFLEDPGFPISPEITQLTGITTEQVKGQSIDDTVVASLMQRCHLVIAHNASFDRRFLERRLPVFIEKHWACSLKDIPWTREGFKARNLEWLAYAHCRVFYDAHRAESDCYMGVHLLATPLPSGPLALKLLLDSARKQYVRLWAIESEFSAKPLLKDREYEWSNGDDGRPRAWFRDVSTEDLDTELGWLASNAYAPGRAGSVRRDPIDRRARYSDRVGRPSPSVAQRRVI